jgi:hypothetical protein
MATFYTNKWMHTHTHRRAGHRQTVKANTHTHTHTHMQTVASTVSESPNTSYTNRKYSLRISEY